MNEIQIIGRNLRLVRQYLNILNNYFERFVQIKIDLILGAIILYVN